MGAGYVLASPYDNLMRTLFTLVKSYDYATPARPVYRGVVNKKEISSWIHAESGSGHPTPNRCPSGADTRMTSSHFHGQSRPPFPLDPFSIPIPIPMSISISILMAVGSTAAWHFSVYARIQSSIYGL